MKKIFIILVVVIVLALLGVSMWWFFSRNTSSTATGTSQTFNPFGLFDTTSNTTTTGTIATSTNGQPAGIGEQQKQFVTIVSEKAVAGSTFATTTLGTSTETFLRFVERETGHIFDYSTATGQKTRISNTTIPRIREAVWGNNGLTVALRYLGDGDTIETFLGTLASSTNPTNESRLTGSYLPKDISTLSIHKTLPETFYLMKTDVGGIGYVVNKGVTENAFSHPFSQWQVAWSGPSSILMTTAPSAQSSGNGFLLNIQTGTFTRVANSIVALTALPNTDGSLILLGSLAQSLPRLSLYNVKTSERTPINISTLPEKCTWTNTTVVYCAIPVTNVRGSIPDDWYQGVISFSDEIWKINTTTENSEFVLDPKKYVPEGVDAIDLHVSSDETYLSFVNKKDGSLWLVDLTLQTY
ncbi:hypothetical protein IPJ70_03085 [Candidatus Campbellbacteria bacterium]|nr:MAG: hypothetical protein IPJ70_03085 [Candidatus Campbellbacteria bacterium]